MVLLDLLRFVDQEILESKVFLGLGTGVLGICVKVESRPFSLGGLGWGWTWGWKGFSFGGVIPLRWRSGQAWVGQRDVQGDLLYFPFRRAFVLPKQKISFL